MNLVLTVLEIVVPVFVLASIGFIWVKLNFQYDIQFVTRLAMTLAVPCLIFVALMQTTINPGDLTRVVLATCVAYGAVTLACFVYLRLNGLDLRTFLAPMTFGNTGNLGLPLALFAFGADGLGYAVIIFALMAVYSFTWGIWIVSGGGDLRKVVREPMVGASILGALFLWQGWETPTWVTNTLELIGQMAIPLMLITLGVAVARLSPTYLRQAIIVSGVKVVICTSIAWSVGLWFALPAIPFAVLVLQVATPVAVTSFMLAEKYGADSDAVAGLVVVSTVLSVGTIPLTLAFVL